MGLFWTFDDINNNHISEDIIEDMIKNTGSYFICKKRKTLDTKTSLNNISDETILFKI